MLTHHLFPGKSDTIRVFQYAWPALVKAAFLLLSALLLWNNAASVAAQNISPDFAQRFDDLRERDARIHALSWRLREGNAPFCARTVSHTGLLLQDAAAYGNRDSILSLLNIRDDIFVQAIAPGSPAHRSAIRPGSGIKRIESVDTALFAFTKDTPWQRMRDINAFMARVGRQLGEVTLQTSLVRKPVTVKPVSICAGWFEVLSSGKSAAATGERVLIGRNFPGFSYPDDELTAALAHEQAHIVLGHAAWLDKHGRNRKNIRMTEREADRLMAWLLHNAGYPPDAAVRFMKRWGPRHDGGLFRKRTHDGWDERVEAIERELPALRKSANGRGKADWSRDFSLQFER